MAYYYDTYIIIEIVSLLPPPSTLCFCVFLLIQNIYISYYIINIHTLTIFSIKGGLITEKKSLQLLIVILCGILLIVIFTGCVREEQTSEASRETALPEIKSDQQSILPNWTDGTYHDYYDTRKMLKGFNQQYPNLVKVFSIGKSVLGKDIWCIKITNENYYGLKSSCLIDGCIHGCEWEGGEVCLYLTEYLLINFNANETITHILNTSEIYIIPLVNPDGREVDNRFNANGVDLNRNFDIDFGRIRGGSLRVGTLFGKKVFEYREFPRLHKWFPSFPRFLLNCGRRPFSEPETQALKDLLYEIEGKHFSFYINCHTAVHNIATPWSAFKPPFEITNEENKIFTKVREWVAENTEYEDAGLSYQGEGYAASGTATDWCFKEFNVPTFAFEILSQDYEPSAGGGKHDSLVHWMKTTIPVYMYLLVNIDNLRQWKTPNIQPPLPEGVPPEPPS